VDPRIRAKVLGLRVEHPDWSLRAIAGESGASRRSVQRWLAAEGLRGPGGVRGAVGAYAAERAVPGVVSQGRGPVALSAVRPMSEADHAAFDSYTGPPASTWWWGSRPEPERWWVYP